MQLDIGAGFYPARLAFESRTSHYINNGLAQNSAVLGLSESPQREMTTVRRSLNCNPHQYRLPRSGLGGAASRCCTDGSACRKLRAGRRRQPWSRKSVARRTRRCRASSSIGLGGFITREVNQSHYFYTNNGKFKLTRTPACSPCARSATGRGGLSPGVSNRVRRKFRIDLAASKVVAFFLPGFQRRRSSPVCFWPRTTALFNSGAGEPI